MNYIAYFRVSTERQGRSGLGLKAQRSAVKNYIKPSDKLLGEFVEVESGKDNSRLALAKALAECERLNATLLIAKLDRLSRSAAFIFQLRDSGVRFVCADMPEANTLTIGIIASLAQYERELISQRTKAALAERKKQGVKLGVRGAENLKKGNANAKAAAARRRLAAENTQNRAATELCILYREKGWTLQQIADKLNTNGHRTRFKKHFKAKTVQRLLQRA